MRIKCFDCEKAATWIYMPASEKLTEEQCYKCDDHVPRGCSCNLEPADGNPENENPENWKEKVDEKGRKWPCVEWEQISYKNEN